MDKDKEVKAYAMLIEKTLEAFGFQTRIAEVNECKDYIQFCLEIAVGTSLDDLLKHDKDLALALASPTGKVEFQAPIPGRSLVGINVPKNKGKGSVEKVEALYKYSHETSPKEEIRHTKGWRKNVGHVCYVLGYLLMKLGDKVSVIDKNKEG